MTPAPTPAQELTEDEWEDRFVSIPNPVDGSTVWDYSDKALMDQMLRDHGENHIWTFSDCDGGQCITPGISRVNRIGYMVTTNPWDDESWAFIPDEDI